MKKMLMITVGLLIISKTSFAQPVILDVSGDFKHDGTIVISGDQFGLKESAAPLLWDNGSSNPPLTTYYDAWLPNNAQQGAQYNMAYHEVPFRGVLAPNSRMSYILGGAHAIADLGDTYNGGGNVGIGKNISSHSYFISYYYRVDPNFDEENNPNLSDNMKEIVLSNSEGSFYPDGWGAFGYAAWCNDPGKDVPDVNYSGPVAMARVPIDPLNQDLPYACGGNNIVYHNSPINGWVKMQWEGMYNQQFDSPQIVLTTYPDGKRTSQSHYGDGLTVLEWYRGPWMGYPKHNDLRFIGIGGFARVPRMNNGTNSFRYFSSVYMDKTHSRVMLGDNEVYDDCTIMEPQIPIQWSSNSIEVSVNLGNLPNNGVAYLYVFNEENIYNSVGFPVIISDSPSQRLYPPENLRIVE
jgi:hypothetical protein